MNVFTVPAIFKAMDQYSGPLGKMQRSNTAFAASMQTTAARANRAFRKIRNGADRVFNKLVNIRSAAGALIAGAAIKKMYDMVTAQAKIGDEAAKTAKRIGLSAEALQEFQFAADRSGVAPAALSKSFEKLNKNVGDLQSGTGSLHTMLQRNNPALHQQLKLVKNNEEAFTLISEAIRKAPNDLQRMSLAQAAFGRSGSEMINLLLEGKDGIAALRAEAVKYGGVMSNEAAAAAEKFVDAQTNMQFALRGLKMMVAVELMPQLQALIEKVTAWTTNNKELIKSKVAEWAGKISDAISWLVKNGDDLIKMVKIVGATLIVLKAITWGAEAAMAALALAQGAATTAQWLFNAAMSANPIGLVIGGVLLLIGLLVALSGHWDSVVTAFKDGGLLAGIKRIGFAIVDALVAPMQTLLEYVSKLPIPGVKHIASGAAHMLQGLRTNLDMLTKVEPKVPKEPTAKAASQSPFASFDQVAQLLSGRSETPQVINPDISKMDYQTKILEEYFHRNELEINIKGETDKAEVKSRGITPKVAPTFTG